MFWKKKQQCIILIASMLTANKQFIYIKSTCLGKQSHVFNIRFGNKKHWMKSGEKAMTKVFKKSDKNIFKNQWYWEQFW